MIYRIYSIFLIGLWLFITVGAGFSAFAGSDIAISVQKDAEIIHVLLPKASPRKVFTLENPDRLVIDVPPLPRFFVATMPPDYKGKWIKSVRSGYFNPQTTRLVFELHAPVKVSDISTSATKPVRLSVRLAERATTPPAVPKAQAAASGEKKTARKKARLKPVVVIDPGHGEMDPGAIGPSGTREKDVVLEYARSLKHALLKTGRYHVVLTRETDRFVMLRKRVEIARKAGGNLFISLHADSAPTDAARGLSVYTLSEQASDSEAAALAARENKSDVIAGMDLSEEQKDVADILISLAQRETKNQSATFADLLVMALEERIKLLQNSHRFAGFAVLKAPDIPSVLVEIGFLSNPREEKMLKSRVYREKVVQGLVAGIDAYFRRQQASPQ